MDNVVRDDYKIFWDEIILETKREISPENFNMWFFPVKYIGTENGKIQISVPSNFFKDRIKEFYLDGLKRKLKDLSGSDIEIEMKVVKKDNSKIETPKPVINSEEKKKINSGSKTHPALRKEFTFENFISGENSNYAANAAMAIAKNPGKAYNPFLIYGGVGLGKTHLLQAIGNYIYNEFPDKKIVFVTAEQFTNEFIDSIATKKPNDFKNKYRTVDVLLIDDIHFFQKKNSVQEEMFNTFNALYNSNKQMCFTCDRPPSELENLTDRMKSRFLQGINADLKMPDYETRLAILKKYSFENNQRIENEVLEYIANSIKTNVRELKAALTNVCGYADLTQKEINLETAKSALSHTITNNKAENISVDLIIKIVADYFNVNANDIRTKKRAKNIALARQISIFIAREMTELSSSEIGNEFEKDHSTVIYTINKMKNEIKYDPTLDTAINKLKSIIMDKLLKN